MTVSSFIRDDNYLIPISNPIKCKGICHPHAKRQSMYAPPQIFRSERGNPHLTVGLPTPPLLLFLRFSVPGVLGLFRLSLPFLVGVISVFSVSDVGLAGGANGPFAAGGAKSRSFSFRPVDERWNAPGSPVIGISSIYSSPYRHVMFSVSSRSTLSRYVSVLVD